MSIYVDPYLSIPHFYCLCFIQACLAVLSMPARLHVGQVRAVAWLEGAAAERSVRNAPGHALRAVLWLVKLRLLDLKHWHDWSQYSKHQHVQIFGNWQNR